MVCFLGNSNVVGNQRLSEQSDFSLEVGKLSEDGTFFVAKAENLFLELSNVVLRTLTVRAIARLENWRHEQVFTIAYRCACKICSRLRVCGLRLEPRSSLVGKSCRARSDLLQALRDTMYTILMRCDRIWLCCQRSPNNPFRSSGKSLPLAGRCWLGMSHVFDHHSFGE